MAPRPRPRAFTLVELMVVILVIVVLAGILVPTVAAMVRASQRNATVADMRKIEAACTVFKAEMGQFPLVPDAPWDVRPGGHFRHDTAAMLNNRALVKALGGNLYLPASRSFLARGGIPSLAVAWPTEAGDANDYATDERYAEAVFVDHWGNPLLYLGPVAEDLENGGWKAKASKIDLDRMTRPRHAAADRDAGNAFGRGTLYVRSNGTQVATGNPFAPAWPGMEYDPASAVPAKAEERDANRARRARLGDYVELWSAGPDGLYSFDNGGSGFQEGSPEGTFYDANARATNAGGGRERPYNADNFSIHRPWDKESPGLMPWE